LVGESHYLPHGAKQHLTPASWYGGSHTTLTAAEAHWINRGSLAGDISDRDIEFANTAFTMRLE
jgi:hypothetical protein